MSTRTGTSFFHVDGHRRHFGRSTGTLTNFTLSYFPCPTYFLASRSDILACRQAHLLFFTILSVQPTFWHCGGIILACRRGHFGMSTGTFTILGFTIPPCPPIVWHRRASFWHVDGHIYYFTLYYSPCPTNILASRGLVDGHMCYFALYHSSLPAYFLASRGVILHVDGVILACRRAHLLYHIIHFTIFPCATNLLASRGVILACRRGHFGMSTGTFTILHFALLPGQPIFWHRRASFWHVDGHIYYFTFYYSPFQPTFLHCGASFWHVDGHIYYLILYYLPFQRTFWHPGASFLGHLLAVAANQLAMSMGRDTFRTVSKHCANAYSWIPVFIHVIQRQKQPQLPQLRGLWFRVDKRKLFLAKNKKQKKNTIKNRITWHIFWHSIWHTLWHSI